MEFCPVCGTMLQFERPDMNHPSRFACPLCPYVCNMQHNVCTYIYFIFLLQKEKISSVR